MEIKKCPKCGVENSIDRKFCKECGVKLEIENEKNNLNDNWKKPFIYHWLVEIIFFIGCSIGALFLILNILSPLFLSHGLSRAYSNNDIYENADSIWQQIFYVSCNSNTMLDDLANMVNSFSQINLMIDLIILVVLIFFTIWNIFKFSRLEKRIIETQEMINKKD